MRAQRTKVREKGQATAEYVLVAAGVAVACIAVLIFVLKPFDGIFSDPTMNLPNQPLTPPDSPPAGHLNEPKSLADCENQGWRRYRPLVNSLAECVRYVNEHPGA